MEVTDFHRKALSQVCRVCGTHVKSIKSLSSKTKYQQLILSIYGIDIELDDESIHPPRICSSCRLWMTRSSTRHSEGATYPTSGRNLATFSVHQEPCSVCSLVHAATKRKSAESESPSLSKKSTRDVDDEPAPASSAAQGDVPLLLTQPVASASLSSLPSSSKATDFREIRPKELSDATRVLFSPDPGLTPSGRKRIWNAKASLHSVRSDHARKRAQGAVDLISSYSSTYNEDETDLTFYLLHNRLKATNDERMNSVRDLWTSSEKGKLTVDDCIALRVGTMLTKGKYAEEYRILKSKGDTSLKPPSALNDRESAYMPGSARFALMDSGNYSHHTPVKSLAAFDGNIQHATYEPHRINEASDLKEFIEPNCAGVAWSYTEAVAKTLEELDESLREGFVKAGLDPDDPSITVHTTIKDGADGMGEVAVQKSKADTFLPDKAFRASFVILKCEVKLSDNTTVVVFEEEKPNSVMVNRPLLEALGDENSPSTATVLLRQMESERKLLHHHTIKVYAGSTTRNHHITIYNSMIDEKLDRSLGGLQGSGSNYICTLCFATKTTAKSQLGSFQITRTLRDTTDTASYIVTNPDKLTSNELTTEGKGVKRKPILTSEPKNKLLDATHADINLGQFFKKIIVREVAGVQKWEASADVKQYIDDAERRLDIHLRESIGLVPSLMMPGNYARDMFKEENEATFLELMSNADRKAALQSVLQKFRNLRRVYRSHSPDKEDVHRYKETAVAMGNELLDNFDYVNWPNYLHKVIEHPQEILLSEDGPGSIGSLSGEGSEAANKLFRNLRENFARRGDVFGGLRDVLWFHWLYTSPKLLRLRAVTRRKYKCSKCGGDGHNVTSCKSKP
ncbi:V(D)J recombination-activating protein 1-like [Diadema setosum]|uniref:V(D)J recombination-activating protein 1-like n=1 Tax=Diadema setosum TaxID=31175 RepID=UPI003B3B5FAF